MADLQTSNYAFNISTTLFYSLLSLGLLSMFCMCNCMRGNNKIRNNFVDTRGLSNKFNIIK